MKDKKRFKIGDWVQYTHAAHVLRDNGERNIVATKFAEPTIAQVTGIALKYEGSIHPGYSGGGGLFDDYDCEAPQFEYKKSVWLWLVRFCVRGGETMVFDEHIEPVEVPDGFYLPINYKSTYDKEYLQEMSKVMKECMKDWPRDKKGRWTKAVPVSVE